MFAGLDVIWGEHCFSVFVVSAFLSVNTCVLLPFPVRWQTRGWATLCAPAQVSPAPPAPSSTRPPPPTPTERSTGGRKARATSRPTVCRAPRKVRSPVESPRFGKLACVFQTCALTPPRGPRRHGDTGPCTCLLSTRRYQRAPPNLPLPGRSSRSFRQIRCPACRQLSPAGGDAGPPSRRLGSQCAGPVSQLPRAGHRQRAVICARLSPAPHSSVAP